MIKFQELKTNSKTADAKKNKKKKNPERKTNSLKKYKISAFLNWSSWRGETESAVSAGTEQSHLM